MFVIRVLQNDTNIYLCVLYVRKKAISGNARKKYYDCASVCSIIRVIAAGIAADRRDL